MPNSAYAKPLNLELQCNYLLFIFIKDRRKPYIFFDCSCQNNFSVGDGALFWGLILLDTGTIRHNIF